MEVNEAIEKFRRGLIGQGSSKNTVASYMRHLKGFSSFCNGKAVEEITAAEISEFLYEARLKADGTEKAQRTMNSLKTALKSFFNSVPLVENPMKKIRIKRVRIERDYLTQDEVRKLIAGVTSIRDRTIVSVFCFLGLRREELVRLRVGDVLCRSVRIFGKGGVERDIPINSALRKQLKAFLRWKEKNGESTLRQAPLFISRKGHGLSMNATYNLVRKWTGTVLGQELYPHSLRHSFASMLVAKRVSIATIQRLMGHANISETQVYLHISHELKAEAVERLDLGED
jgi:site-specific recombinase XerD